MHRTSSSCPSSTRMHAPHSISHNLKIKQKYSYFSKIPHLIKQQYLIELSEEPDTTNLSLYCKQAIPRLCPFNVRTNSHVAVDQTLMVRSPEAETMYLSSKSTTLTAARWPTNTRRRLISVGLTMSQTAILRS